MTGKFLKFFTLGVFVFTALGLWALVVFPVSWAPKEKPREVPQQSRVIIPQTLVEYLWEDSPMEQQARVEQMTLRIPLEEGEILAALLNYDFNGNLREGQIVAYRNLLETESPIYLTYIEYNETLREYKRVWTAPTAATRPGTLSVYTQDLIGDRGVCVLLSGMNTLGQHTLTIFRKIPPGETGVGENSPFSKIAEIRIDGAITVKEVERSQAYQMGMARGQSYSITAYGRDLESSNMLDQVELTYSFNDENGIYVQSRVARIPGAQIEQARVRELLGNVKAFEEFVSGLWYYMSPQGTMNRQYIYFDLPNKEIIFFENETQQVFTWQNSNASRYGLYIRSQNISVSTMRRSINIELESLDSIRIKVDEDLQIKIGVGALWDGSYRKAGSPQIYSSPASLPRSAHINAIYDGPIGRISFFSDGNYELNSGGTARQGKYAFFNLYDQELLELRGLENKTSEVQTNPGGREVYLVETIAGEDPTKPSPRKSMSLSRVRLGSRGIQNLHDGTITLSLAGE